jgi:hypothetical protein
MRSYTSSPPSASMACNGTALPFAFFAMAQMGSHRPLTAEAQVSPCGISGQSNTGTDFSQSSSSPVTIIPPWFSTLIYQPGDEQRAGWWPQLKTVYSPHRHERRRRRRRRLGRRHSGLFGRTVTFGWRD